MANTLKFGNGNWAVKKDSVLAYNDENNNFKPLPFDYTRDTIGTYVDSDGLIKTASNNEARIDYLGNTNGHLLLEPSRTNYITHSEGYTGWGVSRGTLTQNSIVSPDGNTNATLYTKTEGGNEGWAHKSFTVSSVGTYTTSVFMKKGNTDFAHILFWDNSANGVRVWFDLENGAVGTNTSFGSTFTHSSSSIEDYGNGWYRCISTITITGSDVGWMLRVHPSGGDGTINTGSGKTFYYWGAHIEAGSYATSYIPTSGSSVTRAADSCNGAGNSEVFNDSEGVLFVDIAALHNDGSARIISISDGTSSNRIHLFYFVDSNKIYANYRSGGTTRSTAEYTVSNALDFSKVIWKWKSGDFALWVNGFEVDTDANTTMIADGTLDELSLEQGDGGANLYGKTKEIRVYNTALTDAELEYETSYRSLSEMVTELNLNTL